MTYNQTYCSESFEARPFYCVGNTLIRNNASVPATFFLNQTDENDDLEINRAFLVFPFNVPDTYHFGQAMQVNLAYMQDEVWYDNGDFTSGYQDRTTQFYDSVLYKAILLDSLDSFEKVYTDPSQGVAVYKVKE